MRANCLNLRGGRPLVLQLPVKKSRYEHYQLLTKDPFQCNCSLPLL